MALSSQLCIQLWHGSRIQVAENTLANVAADVEERDSLSAFVWLDQRTSSLMELCIFYRFYFAKDLVVFINTQFRSLGEHCLWSTTWHRLWWWRGSRSSGTLWSGKPKIGTCIRIRAGGGSRWCGPQLRQSDIEFKPIRIVSGICRFRRWLFLAAGV